jgi:sensor domain CHASE-containing protein
LRNAARFGQPVAPGLAATEQQMTPSLQKRLFTILAVALTVSGVTSYLILKTVIAPAFNTLESDVAETDLDRAALGIDGQLQQLKAIVGDWAPWDQVNDFILGNDPEFVYRNIDKATLENLDVDILQLYDVDGQRRWTVFVDQGEYAGIETLAGFGDDDPVNATMTSHADPHSVVSGMLMTARGPDTGLDAAAARSRRRAH